MSHYDTKIGHFSRICQLGCPSPLDHDLSKPMRKGLLVSIFLGLLLFWGYEFPYQWWLKYGRPEPADPPVTKNYLKKEPEPELPEPFWGSSIPRPAENKTITTKPKSEAIGGGDLASPILDEIKVCFGEGPLSGISSGGGDLNQLVSSLQNQLGPVQEDLLLEKKVELRMKSGMLRTLVYEWISPEEGSDVYWHETDEEGFPRPIDLPEGAGRDMASFESLQSQGTPGKISETRLIQLRSGLQLGVEKVNDGIQSLSLKDEGHLVKCRRDAVKSFVCDCLN